MPCIHVDIFPSSRYQYYYHCDDADDEMDDGIVPIFIQCLYLTVKYHGDALRLIVNDNAINEISSVENLYFFLCWCMNEIRGVWE